MHERLIQMATSLNSVNCLDKFQMYSTQREEDAFGVLFSGYCSVLCSNMDVFQPIFHPLQYGFGLFSDLLGNILGFPLVSPGRHFHLPEPEKQSCV